MITTEKITEIAEELQGTCNTLENVLGEHGIELDDIPPVMLQELDNITELCESCGWWCEPFEMECGLCEDCRDE